MTAPIVSCNICSCKCLIEFDVWCCYVLQLCAHVVYCLCDCCGKISAKRRLQHFLLFFPNKTNVVWYMWQYWTSFVLKLKWIYVYVAFQLQDEHISLLHWLSRCVWQMSYILVYNTVWTFYCVEYVLSLLCTSIFELIHKWCHIILRWNWLPLPSITFCQISEPLPKWHHVVTNPHPCYKVVISAYRINWKKLFKILQF